MAISRGIDVLKRENPLLSTSTTPVSDAEALRALTVVWDSGGNDEDTRLQQHPVNGKTVYSVTDIEGIRRTWTDDVFRRLRTRSPLNLAIGSVHCRRAHRSRRPISSRVLTKGSRASLLRVSSPRNPRLWAGNLS